MRQIGVRLSSGLHSCAAYGCVGSEQGKPVIVLSFIAFIVVYISIRIGSRGARTTSNERLQELTVSAS